ncbi:MAG: Crp/Fnr family transcriptional regulator [Bacteroidia bacterium]|nr:Crp/Fnr family transcriptional regulator [Bacteroidia bacterium]
MAAENQVQTKSTLINRLIDSFGEMAHLSKEAEEALLSVIQRKEYKKKEILQRADRVSNQLYFVEKGVARTYYYRGGKEITFWIASENEFIGSLASFFSRTPGTKFVETLEDCVLWVFEYDKLEKLYSSSQELERMGRLFTSYGLCVLEKKFEDFHSLTAVEKYNLLISKYPQILQTVSLGVIASYLGISQETLSRVRAQIAF